MPENIAETVQKVIQDLVAPDVRELKVLVQGLQKQLDEHKTHVDQRFNEQKGYVDQRFDEQNRHMDQRFDAQRETGEAHFKALMAAFGEFKAQAELANMRVLTSLSERVAVLEARHH